MNKTGYILFVVSLMFALTLCQVSFAIGQTLNCGILSGGLPNIDGTFDNGLWPTNPQLTINSPIETYVYCMNDATNLYMLVDAVGDVTNNALTFDECLLVFGVDQIYVPEVCITNDQIDTNELPAGTQVDIGFGVSPNSANNHRIYEWMIPLDSINTTFGELIDFASPAIEKQFCGFGPYFPVSIPFDGGETDGGDERDNVWPPGVTAERSTWGQLQLNNLQQTLADSILFPWVVKSDDVTTVISVVNTAQTWAESVGLPFHNNRIHIEYWHKMTTANEQEEQCTEYNFEVTSSKDDMVTWDMAGHFNNGLPMFNDTSNEVIAVPDMTLAVANPRRAFLIVDNATDALIDAGTNVDGTMYGEATVIEHKTGAAWGYIAYNAIGRYEDFSDADHRDQQGEVIGNSETTQTTLLNPNDATTKLFVTPTLLNQRGGNLNASVQLCRFPQINDNSDPYTGDCESGGIWNNEEGGFSFTVKKNIVCTTADNIVDFFGGAGTSAYAQWVASGKAGWAYLVTHPGYIDMRDGTEKFYETDEAIIGKLEFATGLSWDGSIADTINTFVWLRDNANYLENCAEFPDDWRCEPGGINIIHNEFYQERGACCIDPIGSPPDFCLDLTESSCFDIAPASATVNWTESETCETITCG